MSIGTLLVYGTLRPNRGETVVLGGYKMHTLGRFPGVVCTAKAGDRVVCERIQIKDEAHLAALDAYEGCNGNTPSCLYHRSKNGDDWIYLYNGPLEDYPEVPDGDWLAFKGQSVGSNAQLTEA